MGQRAEGNWHGAWGEERRAKGEGRRVGSRFKVPGSMDFKVTLLLRYRFLFWLYVDFFIYFLLLTKRTSREKFILTGANPTKSK